ncbi:cupin domain-containing protein [Halorussus salinisoli]|uniref:cupin domain-containing protein n=1 Tax=Halorussus salinisoli TaxID=2558242 RepID=UPI0010C1B064|nr:cupin domain-containing protein [Halorussus salinisoli]
MTSPFVVDANDVEGFTPPHHESTTSRELVNPDRGSDRIVFRISELAPGGRDSWHAHESSEQLLYILDGHATFWVGKPGDDDESSATRHELSPESFVYIPEQAYHRLRVTGDEPLRAIAIWVPPYESFDEWESSDG